MAYQVYLTLDAEADLKELFEYVHLHDSQAKAMHLLDRIEKEISALSHQPLRGAYPKELVTLGIRQYREAHFKPYRIIYQVVEKKVYVMLIADGRRDMQSLLERRLIEG